jgi:hypothetical protein
MGTTTENYGLASGVVTDDFVEPEHNNRVADVLDRVLGSFLRKVMADGAASGWLIQSDKTVGAGEGLVAASWCKTTAGQAITGLTNGAVNHVFAQTTTASAPDGSVAFYAALSATKPEGHAYLGTLELDANGDVVAIDNEPAGADRNLYRLEIRTLSGSGTASGLGAGSSVEVEITHAPLRLTGGIGFDTNDPEVTCKVLEHHARDAFRVELTNGSQEEKNVSYAWSREGVGEG